LRLLLNFQLRDRFLLTLLLLGQPELKQKVEDNKQLEQRIAVKYYIDALGLEDTKKYIQHRLAVAGQERQIFTDDAIKLLHEHSGGIPRVVNHICDICLLSGSGKEADKIDETIVRQEIKQDEK